MYVPLVQSNVATDSRPYEAAARALDRGAYTTPLFAAFYFETTKPFVAANNVDLTGLQIPRRAWQAPERQTFRPPGYPLYLAVLGGGGRGASRAAALLGQALLFGLGAWLLALTVRRWWGPRLALASTAAYALDPWSKHYVSLILSETLAGVLAVGAAYAFTRAWQERAAAWWAAAGALCAALTLVRAVFAVAVPLLLLGALLRGRLRAGVVAAASALLLLVPWLAWTDSVTGSPVLASYGEGFNLLVAAHGEGHGRSFADVTQDPAFRRDFASVHALAPSAAELLRDPAAHPRYLADADARMRSLALDRYGSRLVHDPAQVAWESVYRMFYLWNAHEDWYQPGGALLALMRTLDAALLVLAGAGVALVLVRDGAARGVAIFLLVYTAVLGVHHVEARFAIPLRGLYLAFVTFAGSQLAGSRTGRRASRGEQG